MTPIANFDELLQRFHSCSQKISIAVVCPGDDATTGAMEQVLCHGTATFHAICVGSPDKTLQELHTQYPDRITIHHVASAEEASAIGVRLVHESQADILMKGTVNTDTLLREVLNKECGLLPEGHVLSHATLVLAPAYGKMLLFSDAAVIPRPTLPQLQAMVRYDLEICRKLGVSRPQVALIHFSEKTNPKFPHTIDYLTLIQMAGEGAFGETDIAGPMDVKTACDRHSAEVKGIDSTVTGNADILIFPNLEASNTFYKTVSFFGGATMAGMITGAKVPIVLPSRADSMQSKLYSMALACVAGIQN